MKGMNCSMMKILGMLRRLGKAGIFLACLSGGADLWAQLLWGVVSVG